MLTINLSRLVARILDSLNAGNGGWGKTLVHFILQLEAGHNSTTQSSLLYIVFQSLTEFQLKHCCITRGQRENNQHGLPVKY